MGIQLKELHHWLHRKISIAEGIEQDLIQWALADGLPAQDCLEEMGDVYGKPMGEKPLKQIIDSKDPFGWLEQQMKSVEARQASLITRILQQKPEAKGELLRIFAEAGEKKARGYQQAQPQGPEEVYIVLNDYLLEGMPNQRVNEVIDGNENLLIWRTTVCVHKPYWDQAGGDVNHFYELRAAWVKAFVETLCPGCNYEKRPNGNHKIFCTSSV